MSTPKYKAFPRRLLPLIDGIDEEIWQEIRVYDEDFKGISKEDRQSIKQLILNILNKNIRQC